MICKKTFFIKNLMVLVGFFLLSYAMYAQNINKIEFCDRKYEYVEGNDSITLYLKFLDETGHRVQDLTPKDLQNYFLIKEDGVLIPNRQTKIEALNSGQRIPADYTFSVLVDLSIPLDGRKQIFQAVRDLVESAPDSCVYLSFFGDEVSKSDMVTQDNYNEYESKFMQESDSKYFYSALYAKMAEFSKEKAEHEDEVRACDGYIKNKYIQDRALKSRDHNILLIFTEGNVRPADEYVDITYVNDYKDNLKSESSFKVYAFYYLNKDNSDVHMIDVLKGVTMPRDPQGNVIQARKGRYAEAHNLAQVMRDFNQVVEDAKYDFAYTYSAKSRKIYSGNIDYVAEWKGDNLGSTTFSIGSPEHPWPIHKESITDSIMKYFIALIVAFLTIVFFFGILKIVVPFFKSKAFARKYYKKFEPDSNVIIQKCYYCKQPLKPGDLIVDKCVHKTHVSCWIQNGYKCPEYGQSCKVGIQEHIDWSNLFSKASFRDCYQIITGILAALISWMLYEMTGRGGFTVLAQKLTSLFYSSESTNLGLYNDCVTRVSSFLMIGLLLGFFLSLIFRYNDEYRNKDWKILSKILLLSLFSSFIGCLSFLLGANFFYILLSLVGTTYIPWYCSLPAYVLFSVCFSLSLTLKSTIPVKSALFGGVCSIFIGFLVLYFSSSISTSYAWMSMLLDFVIYGGGLGASLITVRVLSENYFLEIVNGIKADTTIAIHKWMGSNGGGKVVSIGMAAGCEIQMNWEKSNKVEKEHVNLYIDHERQLPILKPLAAGVLYNNRVELPVNKPVVLSNNDTFKIGDTIFKYVENLNKKEHEQENKHAKTF